MKLPLIMANQMDNVIGQARNGGLPSKMGPVWLIQAGPGGRPRRTRVRLSVYTSNFDCYVVVSQEKLICKDCGYINLKNATVREVADDKSYLNHPSSLPEGGQQQQQRNNGQCTFQIVPKYCDGNVLTFVVNFEAELEDWFQAMASTMNRQPLSLKDTLSLRKHGQGGHLPLTPRSPQVAMPILEEGTEE